MSGYVQMGDTLVHINDGGPKGYVRRVVTCPVESRRRRFAGYHQQWYGTTLICLGCGDMWTDGEMHERPFRPRWREQRVVDGKRYWLAAGAA